jgi:hypothetical protein
LRGEDAYLCTVIASEAKQSISPSKERMDCFASLAMTVVDADDRTEKPQRTELVIH